MNIIWDMKILLKNARILTMKDENIFHGSIVTEDGSNAAHYENTVLVTKDGVEILSLY